MLVGTIMESRNATFFESKCPMKNIFFESECPMKNTPSISSHETIIPHEQFILIEHFEEPHV
jgi:hypothetical protein